MSNPTELPDLDKLEALARAATPGEWNAQRHGCVVGGPMRKYVNGSAQAQLAAFNVTFHDQAPDDEPERQQANAEFCAAANPAAVLALIALARRAQPESEAPQVVAQVWLDMDNWMDVEISELPTWERKGFKTRTLYTAQAAQQAAPTPRIIGGQPWSKEAEMTEGWLAAQQAAAPGALDLMNADEMAALRRFDETCQDGEGYDVPKTMMQRLAAIGVVRRTSGSYYETTEFGLRVLDQPAPSAPGTPEAPILPEQSDMDAYANSGYHRFMTFDAFKAFRADCASRAAQLDGGQGAKP